MEDSWHKARESALRCLTYRAYSAAEIKQKLMNKGYTAEDVARAVVWLLEYGYLDDRKLAANYIESRMGIYGFRRIQAELKRRGIDEQCIFEEWEQAAEGRTLEESLYHLAQKQMSKYSEGDSRKIRQKIMRYLLRKGFSYEEVDKTIGRLLREENGAKQTLP